MFLGVENVDFERNVETAGAINKWVEDNTNDKIRNLIKPGDIDGATRMILVNALYFSGVWLYPFDSYATSKKNFFKTKDNTAEVDTMLQVDTFNYVENKALNAKFLELPYQGNTSVPILYVHATYYRSLDLKLFRFNSKYLRLFHEQNTDY